MKTLYLANYVSYTLDYHVIIIRKEGNIDLT